MTEKILQFSLFINIYLYTPYLKQVFIITREDAYAACGSNIIVKFQVEPQEPNVLTTWSPWQNTLQHSSKSGHSEETKTLVDLMQFMCVQGSRQNRGVGLMQYMCVQ